VRRYGCFPSSEPRQPHFSNKPNFQIFGLIFAGKCGEPAVIWNPELETRAESQSFQAPIHRSETIARLV
jgi:hypothetical protein